MNKAAIVTGASRGIGRATARLLAKNGYSVVIQYLHSEEAAKVLLEDIRGHGGCAIAVCADVANRGDVERMVKACLDEFGGVDLLVNNAGIAQSKVFSDLTDDDWGRMMDVNVKGTFYCCQSVLPEMLRVKRGKIINISSIWGITGASCEVHYSASKAAVIGLTRALAKELGPSGIQVNCVAPGAVRTDMLKGLTEADLQALTDETPLGRLGTPEDIAGAILFLASPQADFITGQVLSPNGGYVI